MDALGLFKIIERANKDTFGKAFRYFMKYFGGSLLCNRFVQGNLAERLVADAICSEGLRVERLPNKARFDCDIETFGKLSIKYSSDKDITLHNSRSTNKDMKMVDTLLITPKKWYLLIISSIEAHGVDLTSYLVNTGDSLQLKRTILTELEYIGYDYILDYDLKINKKECQHKAVNDIIIDYILSQIHAEE